MELFAWRRTRWRDKRKRVLLEGGEDAPARGGDLASFDEKKNAYL